MKTINGYEVVFESTNIYYVRLTKKLINDYLAMVNDPEIARLISRNIRTYTYEEELEWVESKLKEKALCYSMLEKATGEYIGNIEIMKIENSIGELGISITATKQNKHFGTEAIKALLDYAREELKLNGMELNVYTTNPRALHCYEKVGFVRDGVGRTMDDIHMKISLR